MNQTVVHSHITSEGIVVVKMEDRQHRNTFSEELIEGLINTFEQINTTPEAKVVVIHGFDSYFCCGGTQEELMQICEGKITFADLNFYRLLLDCPVPTIAAMQGHAIGGGLAFGAYADHIIMAEQCIYCANFMKYGFTPGMGATYIIPYKFGPMLGNEILFSAKNYYGKELKERSIAAKVVKKDDVLQQALELASVLAQKPVVSLKVLKEHLNKNIQKELPPIIEEELKLHDITFHRPEVRERIEQLFGK